MAIKNNNRVARNSINNPKIHINNFIKIRPINTDKQATIRVPYCF